MDADALNEEFVMKESMTSHFIICSFFFILFGVSLFNLLENERVRNNSSNKQALYALLLFSVIIGTINLLNALKQKIILTINNTGIYSMGELKTNWQNFINARLFEEQNSGSSSVHSFVFIQYYKKDAIYESEIRILDTYDSSAEDIIDAIKKFNPLLTQS